MADKDDWIQGQDQVSDSEEVAEELADSLRIGSRDHDILEVISALATELHEDVQAATSCETERDFKANIRAALTSVAKVKTLLQAAKAEVKKDCDLEADEREAANEVINDAMDTLMSLGQEFRDLI